MRTHAQISIAALTICVCALALAARGEMIAENPTTAQYLAGYPAIGQKVLTASIGGPWNQLTFNVHRSITHFAGEPFAFETLYLLSQEYLGWPSNLSAVTPGYIAHTSVIQAAGDGSEWAFAPEITLQPNQTYWFYTDKLSPTILLSFTQNTYAGGTAYYAFTATDNYLIDTATDMAFQLKGVPEPGTGILFVLAVAIAVRRKPQGAA